MIGELYGKAKVTTSEHIKNIFEDGELDGNSVVRFYRTTVSDEKNYQVQYVNLSLVLAVGYRVRSTRGVIPPVLVPPPMRISGQFLPCIDNRWYITQ
ncbi:2-hydroxyacid dehydrogenase [Pectobacterium polaris]|nr:2-hydroxyacid dehydrogenase [Pectobacterium polaris]